jgi:hypothetical protein
LVKPEENQIINEPQPINEPVTEFVPELGDDEVREMFLVEDEEVIPETTPIPPVVEEPVITPDIVVEETPIIIPIVEEPIVEEVVTEIIPEISVESLSETTDEEKKN